MEKKKEVVVKNALQELAARLKVNPESLKTVLKATVCRGFKIKGSDKYRPITDEEFIAFVAVANAYQLNPLTKEIYAYPDSKSGGIIPVVSTDGWNKLMTSNPKYKTHRYNFSEETATLTGGKECPTWIEIVIEKQDSSQVVVREYLDECFRELTYANPWQTHTKRMLRHKAKIQGAREAFGFAGIYDMDEAQRIAEASTGLLEAEIAGKPPVEIPQKKSLETPKEEKPNAYKSMLDEFAALKEGLGPDKYYEILNSHGYKKSNEIKKIAEGELILADMKGAFAEK